MHTNRYPHMVHEYFVGRVRRILQARRQRIAAMKTRAEAEAYVAQIRNAARKCFAPIPKRTPLNAETIGREELSDCMLEKVVFESRPGLLVTGSLYIPRNLRANAPGVLGLCGHSDAGKGEPIYQAFVRTLTKKGFVTFIFDPIDQGERIQYYPKEGGLGLGEDGRPKPGMCWGHNLTGNQLVLLDDFFGTWRVWDAIRALDYLCSRPEVDTTRLGVTGNSGGGTLSGYLTALDKRLTMAAPSCFVCSYQANLEWELPCDSEQNPPGIIAAGLDHADLLMCHAPRPTLVMGQYHDFFSEVAARRSFEEIRKVYRLLGAEENVECFIGPRNHGYHIENREAMYKFFLTHAGLKGTSKEGRFKPLPAKRLFATPRGETYRAGSKRVFEITADRAGELASKRGRPSVEAVVTAANKVLRMPKTVAVPPFRSLHDCGRFGTIPNQRWQFAVETEPGIQTILTTFGREHGTAHLPKGKVTLFVGNASGQEDARKIQEVRALTKAPNSLVVADPRGIGQSMAQTAGSTDLFDNYGSDFMYATNSDMLGESYLGRRVFDILQVFDVLLDDGATRVDLLGRGMGSIIVAFAALLHPTQPRVKIFNYLPSYDLIAQTPVHKWPLSSMPRGVLKYFDLPDVYRALGRRLTKAKPWDAKMRPLKE